MSTRERAPRGAPCWVDLWTSDVEGSRTFYSELFGWEAQTPSPEFGGYFMFTRDGSPIAGGMGDMGQLPANNTWKVYFATDDIEETVRTAATHGGEVFAPPTAVADLGTQAVLNDSTGAALGLWQPNTFPGLTVIGEPGAPSWFELNARDYATAVAFYRDVLSWDTAVISDSEEFRYTTMRSPEGGLDLAGIFDAATFLAAGSPSSWVIYWMSEDVDASTRKVAELGGSILRDSEDTPYGRMATVADPSGAQFKLHTPNR